MKRLYLILLFYFLGVVYLLFPSPTTPNLSRSFRSPEEGDTWQNPDQKGYYTDLLRDKVLPEMTQKFSLRLNSLRLPSYRLNYPPEQAFTLVRDQLNSSYLEEIVYPLRESLFVNGWEPENDPQLRHLPVNKRSDLIAKGKVYQSKVTLKPVFSHPWWRLLTWTLIFPASYFVAKSLKLSFNA